VVASLAACWSELSGLLVSSSVSSRTSRLLIDLLCLILFVCRYPSFFSKRGVCFLTVTVVLNVAIIGERSEVMS